MSHDSMGIACRSLTAFHIQCAAETDAHGTEISRPHFDTHNWYPAQVPSTVLGALVACGQYPNPYVGTQLQDIPGDRFAESWWYRTEFDLTAMSEETITLLKLEGINYTADIWLNGQQIAEAESVCGAFRRYHLDITDTAQSGINALALRVTGPRPGDYAPGFVDWNPAPPDGNMGLFRPVTVHRCQGISLRHAFVQTDVDLTTLNQASLTVTAELENHMPHPVSGTLRGTIDSIQFKQVVRLDAHEQQQVAFDPNTYPSLVMRDPRLWWPHDLGERHLYQLSLEFIVDDQVADRQHLSFGIRMVEDTFTDEGHRGFKINGQAILVRGAGWTDDLLLADTPEKLETQIRYARDMNLNTIRLEGIWGKDQTLYDLCDQYGLLLMVGWSCHWEHEQYLGAQVDNRFGGPVSESDIDLLARSWQDQLRWLRNHPSILVWSVASDKVPHPDLERRYIDLFKQDDPTRPYLASTGGVGSEQAIIGEAVVESDISGATGVKMLGPYAYTPPVYWYEDTQRGGAYGFNTETGPGAQVPVLSSLKQMFPVDQRWPINETWTFHCALNEFDTLDRFNRALEKRYGPATNVETYARKAQILNYELIRPMFEAFRVNKGQATGVIQWMLNAAWPKLYWQLYDWYLMPTGAFYGTKKANEPLQLIYNYATHSVHLANDTALSYQGLRADVHVLDLQARIMDSYSHTVDAPCHSSQPLQVLPEYPDISTTYFLDLRLYKANDMSIATNLYWLSTRADRLDYQAKVEPWEFYTPSRQYADYTLLNELPTTPLAVYAFAQPHCDHFRIAVTLHNTGSSIAFGVELTITNTQTTLPVVPVHWDDNYLVLLPNESRVVSVAFDPSADYVLSVQGWNTEAVTVETF